MLEVLHVVEQMTVIRFVDAHHLLHGLGGQADLVSRDLRAGVEPLTDVDQLDLVRVDHVEFGVGVGGAVDGGRRRLRPRQIGCDLPANPLLNRHRALTFRM